MSYSEKVIDHYKEPRNVGSFTKKEEGVGTGLVGAPECGDVMKLQIKVENNKIVDAKFKTFGCGSAIASSSLATEWVKGKSIDEAMAIQNTEIVKELSLPPVKIHCSVLAEDAIKAAISDYKNRKAVESPWLNCESTHNTVESLKINISGRQIQMNEEILNIQIRKFLKKVGVQSQREIEQAVRRSIENNSLAGIDKLEASVLLEVPEVGIKVSIESEIKLEWC